MNLVGNYLDRVVKEMISVQLPQSNNHTRTEFHDKDDTVEEGFCFIGVGAGG